MCGRTVCSLGPDQLCAACQSQSGVAESGKKEVVWREHPVDSSGTGRRQAFLPSFNVCPSQFCPVLMSGTQSCLGLANDGIEACSSDSLVLMPMRWGFVPHYHRGKLSALPHQTINARDDTLRRSVQGPGMFHHALQKRQRCVAVVDAFYEWEGMQPPKQPRVFYWDQPTDVCLWQPDTETIDSHGQWTGRRLLMLAAVFDRVLLLDEEKSLFSYAVVTVDAPAWYKSIHNRMPAILENERDVREWVDVDVCSAEALQLLRPLSRPLSSHLVDRSFVNNVSFNGSQCIRPIGSITSISPRKPHQRKVSMKMESPPSKTLLSYFKRKSDEDEKQCGPPVKQANIRKEERDE